MNSIWSHSKKNFNQKKPMLIISQMIWKKTIGSHQFLGKAPYLLPIVVPLNNSKKVVRLLLVKLLLSNLLIINMLVSRLLLLSISHVIKGELRWKLIGSRKNFLRIFLNDLFFEEFIAFFIFKEVNRLLDEITGWNMDEPLPLRS